MSNSNQLKILITLIFLALFLTGCAGHTSIRGLPTELASKIEKKFGGEEGFKFNNLVLIDAITGKAIQLRRTEKVKIDGKLEDLYETRHLDGPVSVEKVKNVLSYSVIGVRLENTEYSGCNIITINGYTELICKKSGDTESQLLANLSDATESISERIGGLPGNLIVTLKNKIVSKLEELGEGIVNDVGFVIGYDMHALEAKLSISEEYERVPVSFLDSVKELSSRTSSTVISYKKNPCCTTEIRNGREVETCAQICF